jgi:hypothetical protein
MCHANICIDTPTVTAVSPTAGTVLGGTDVIITGTNFHMITLVKICGTSAAPYQAVSATQINARTASHADSGGLTCSIEVTNPKGMGSLENAFAYVGNVPTVTGISPSTGVVTGGANVTIAGTNFVEGEDNTTVFFGDVEAAEVDVDSPTSIIAITPAHAAGAVTVTVTTLAGDSADNGTNDDYTYGTAPVVSSLSPTTGSTAGGTSVMITGNNFLTASAVTFGSIPAASYSVDSATQITATSPAGSAGTVSVSVTTAQGTSDTSGSGDDFTYTTSGGSSGGTTGGSSPVCGNNQVESGEECDNGTSNGQPGERCGGNCRLRAGGGSTGGGGTVGNPGTATSSTGKAQVPSSVSSGGTPPGALYTGACCDTSMGKFVDPNGDPADVDVPEYTCPSDHLFFPRPPGFDPTKTYAVSLAAGEASGDRFCPHVGYCCVYGKRAVTQEINKGVARLFDLKSQRCVQGTGGGQAVTFGSEDIMSAFCVTDD